MVITMGLKLHNKEKVIWLQMEIVYQLHRQMAIG